MLVCIPHPALAAAIYPASAAAISIASARAAFDLDSQTALPRYKLNACIIVLNNNGITGGAPQWKEEWNRNTEGALKSPASALSPTNRYDLMADVFGGQGWHVQSLAELRAALPAALALQAPGLVHVRINPVGHRKKQQFEFDPTGGNTHRARSKTPAPKL